jgi:quinol monooxygenase YgiN
MATQDTCCTIAPYFQVHDGKLESFKILCERFIDKTKKEPDCLYYGFTFDGDKVHCREGYKNAQGLLNHLENVGAILQEALAIADITRLEVHGPADQLTQLQEPLADFNPEYWQLEYGFRH